MVLPAADALNLTNNANTTNNATDVQTEVSLAENRIRRASSVGLFTITYNATLIGNPEVDPRTHTDLPPNQIEFFNLFTTAGYTVTVDTSTGFWVISWTAVGAETLVQVYSFRTTFDPTAITTSTISAIESYFASLRPIVHSTVRYNGFIDEAGFGGTSSQYFEFTIVVDQQDAVDHSTALKNSIIGLVPGYTTNNSNIYRTVF